MGPCLPFPPFGTGPGPKWPRAHSPPGNPWGARWHVAQLLDIYIYIYVYKNINNRCPWGAAGVVGQLLPRKLWGYMGGNHFANSIYCFGQVVIGFVVVKGVGKNTQDIEED